MTKRLKQSQVLTYLTHDGPVYFRVLDLKERIDIQFISKLLSFPLVEKGLFDMLYIEGGYLDKQPISDQLYKI